MLVDMLPGYPRVSTDEQTTRLHLDAAGRERTFLERRQVNRRIVEPTEYEVTATLKTMQAGCDPAVVASQVIDLTLDTAAEVTSKRQLTERTFLRAVRRQA